MGPGFDRVEFCVHFGQTVLGVEVRGAKRGRPRHAEKDTLVGREGQGQVMAVVQVVEEKVRDGQRGERDGGIFGHRHIADNFDALGQRCGEILITLDSCRPNLDDVAPLGNIAQAINPEVIAVHEVMLAKIGSVADRSDVGQVFHVRARRIGRRPSDHNIRPLNHNRNIGWRSDWVACWIR
ncbi:MAG: hypothetical protein ACRBK7_07230 [Acidimicrobiales bacterium]